jgi:hypothetical protein
MGKKNTSKPETLGKKKKNKKTKKDMKHEALLKERRTWLCFNASVRLDKEWLYIFKLSMILQCSVILQIIQLAAVVDTFDRRGLALALGHRGKIRWPAK